jgi:hypothetical protein
VTAQFASDLLGWKASSKNALGWAWVPNSADVDNAASLTLAAEVLDALGFANPNRSAIDLEEIITPANPGALLEVAVQGHLTDALPELDPSRNWAVRRGASITQYAQYQHLAALSKAIANNPNLRVTLGIDYLITPDVTIGLLGTPTLTEHPWLHAAVACKWTIRSDRVQNIRHENANMIRHRRGRLPHLITVTAEPLPSRLASIARGTGEVDVTYHIAYDQLAQAIAQHGSPSQQAEWDEVTGQGRVRDYELIAQSLVDW